MISTYDKNLAALRAVNPLLWVQLHNVHENNRFELFQGKDPLQINLYDTQFQVTLYDHPVEETIQKIESYTQYDRYPFLYFFGLGNGIFVKSLLANPLRQRVIIFEPEIEIIFIVLNLIDFSDPFLSGTFEIHLAQSIDYTAAIALFTPFDSKIYAKTFFIDVTIAYYDRFSEQLTHLSSILTTAIEHSIIGHGNDASDSLIGLNHHIRHLPIMLSSPPLISLKNIRKNGTAIIISTGPSLAKQLPLLKEAAPYATLICIDASMPILEKNNIKPDIVVSLERVEASSIFYKNSSDSFREGILFVAASLVHPELLSVIQNHSKIIATRPFNYTKYFALDDYGYIGTGMSAANMAHDLASYMGHKQCILIGQDLAFGDDGTSHSNGHIFGSDEVKNKMTDCYVTRYGGEGEIRTTLVWNLFRGYFERDIANTSHEMTTFNATEGGAHINGSLELPFRELCEQLLQENLTKKTLTLPIVEHEKSLLLLSQTRVKLQTILREGSKFEKKITSLYLTVVTVCEEIITLNEEGELDRIDFNKLHKLNRRIDKIKDLFNNPIFGNIYFDIIQSYILHQEMDLALISVSNPSTPDEKQAQLVEWIMKHQYWLLSLAGGINVVRSTIKEAMKSWKKSSK